MAWTPPLLDALPLKVGEADYFLRGLEAETDPLVAEYLFSAFASAARSVTWVLQKCMAGVQGFDEWYTPRQEALRADPLARFMKEQRNSVQKGAQLAIKGGHMSAGGTSIRFFFDWALAAEAGIDGNSDVVSLCRSFFAGLVILIHECLRDFRYLLDPHTFLTPKWMAERNLTPDDLEEELGYPRGWTSIKGGREEWPNRIRALLRNQPAWPDISEVVGRRGDPATD